MNTSVYDLPPVMQTPIEASTVRNPMHHENIRGIRSGVLTTCRIVESAPDRPDDFLVMYSGLDTFEVAWSCGWHRNFDGMFACTPDLASRMYGARCVGVRPTRCARRRSRWLFQENTPHLGRPSCRGRPERQRDGKSRRVTAPGASLRYSGLRPKPSRS